MIRVMPGLTIRLETPADLAFTVVMVLDGDIDDSTAGEFHKSLAAGRLKKITRFILDLGRVRYINSGGFSGLTGFAEALVREGGEVLLVKVQQKVRMVLDMLGLADRFKMFLTMDDAVDYLRRMPSVVSRPVPPVAAGSVSPLGAPSKESESTLECKGCKGVLLVQNPGTYKCPRCGMTFALIGPGKANFNMHRKGVPLEMSFGLSRAAIDGVLGLVRGIALENGWDPGTLERAVQDILETVLQKAYGGDANRVCHLLLQNDPDRFEVTCVHYGVKLALTTGGGDLFQTARSLLDHFELKHLEGSGNIINGIRSRVSNSKFKENQR